MHVNSFIGLLAFAAPPAGSQSGPQQNPLIAFLPMILLVVVFYFILIRPQQQRAKLQAKMLEALKSGDKVVTSAGIVGTVVTVKEKDKTVTIRSGDAKFEVTKSSITEIIRDDTSTTTSP
jgi:preprotein translocase subunit YajC